jgi:hypothetical protein
MELGLRLSDLIPTGRTIWIADAHQGDEKRCLKKERERIRPRSPLLKGYPPPEGSPTSKL